jgi:hypothetical protein
VQNLTNNEKLEKIRSSLHDTGNEDPYITLLNDLSTFDKKTDLFQQSDHVLDDDPTYTLFDFPKSYQELLKQFSAAKVRYDASKDSNETALKDIMALEKEIITKEAEIVSKKTAIETAIATKITELKTELASYHPDKDFTATNNNLKSEYELYKIRLLIENIRYLEHGNTEIVSSALHETTALTNIDRINKEIYGL